MMMKWKLVFALAACAVIMGAASVLGYTQNIEPFCWIAIAVVCAFVLARGVTQKLFLHGLYVGVAQGIVNGAIQAAFFNTYLRNNPDVAAQMSQNPFPFSPSVFVLLSSPLIGAAFGVAMGLLTLLAAKLVRRN
jgi:hypothetical protein